MELFKRSIPMLAAMFWTTSATAATVVLVHPSRPAAGMTEALARINGELSSAGFAIEVVDGAVALGTDGESRNWLEQLATGRGADAVVAVMGDKTPDSVEVWVIDKVTGKSVVRRVPFRPESPKGPETLAIQAVELLRASFLEIDLASKSRLPQVRVVPPPTVVRFVELDRKAEPSERFGVELGGTAIVSFDGVGPAAMPMVRFDWAIRPWLVAEVTAAGLGSRSSVKAAAGTARVSQDFVLLGASYRFRGGKRLTPFVALSAGALHTSVEGRAENPFQGHNAHSWSLLLDGEFGAAATLHDRLYLSLSAHAQCAEPYPAIRFAGAAVATSARPNALVTLTMGAWL
ncbi:MAG TPA: hypothetical protein VIV60_10425 [Polyangiaceae bacterium]